jgi:Leucine Rich repeat
LEGATSILKALTESNTTLTFLWLVEDYERHSIPSTILGEIYDVETANREGRRLLNAEAKVDLSSKFLNSRRTTYLANDLANSTTVETLILTRNNFGDKGSAEIAVALTKNCFLASLSLDNNSIGDAGCSAIARALCRNNRLMKFFLDGNNIGLEGATALAETLRVNDCLQLLGLGRNRIGSDGAMAFACALTGNTKLTRLDLDENGISDEGATALLKVLKKHNRTLSSLKLAENVDISPVLHKTIDFIVASRLALYYCLKHLHKPLEKKLISFAIHGLQARSMRHEKLHGAHCHEMAAGAIFHLVRPNTRLTRTLLAESAQEPPRM